MKKITTDRKLRKKIKVRSKLFGTRERPKISVFRSNKYIYAQAIDDEKRVTIASASSYAMQKKQEKVTKAQQAKLVGNELAKKLLKKGIKRGIFDKGMYVYLGRVQAVAEGLREGGIQI